MLDLSNKVSAPDYDDGSRAEDLFRRAAFGFAVSTKRMVDAAAGLGPNTKVAHTSLVDIEYARVLLDSLYALPKTKSPGDAEDKANGVTVDKVRDSVSGLAARISNSPKKEVMKTPFNARIAPRAVTSQAHHMHRGADLSAPVFSSSGKMTWAAINCPACPSKKTERCRRADGSFMEKPHKQRKTLAEQDS